MLLVAATLPTFHPPSTFLSNPVQRQQHGVVVANGVASVTPSLQEVDIYLHPLSGEAGFEFLAHASSSYLGLSPSSSFLENLSGASVVVEEEPFQASIETTFQSVSEDYCKNALNQLMDQLSSTLSSLGITIKSSSTMVFTYGNMIIGQRVMDLEGDPDNLKDLLPPETFTKMIADVRDESRIRITDVIGSSLTVFGVAQVLLDVPNAFNRSGNDYEFNMKSSLGIAAEDVTLNTTLLVNLESPGTLVEYTPTTIQGGYASNETRDDGYSISWLIPGGTLMDVAVHFTYVPEYGAGSASYNLTAGEHNITFDVALMNLVIRVNGSVRLDLESMTENPAGGAPFLSGFLGRFVNVEVNDTSVLESLTLTFMYYDEEVDAAGLDESSLAIYYWDGASWVKLNSTVDTESNTITVTVSHLTYFAIIGNCRGDVLVSRFLPLLLVVNAIQSSQNVTPILAGAGATAAASIIALFILRRRRT